MLNGKKNSTTIFIVGSLFALLIFVILIIFIKSPFINNSQGKFSNIPSDTAGSNLEYALDPFITKTPESRNKVTKPIINGDDPELGAANALVNIILFSDYQCAYCYEEETAIKKILEKYNNQVKLIWKDYPSEVKNSASWLASLAGRCAQEQGKFWEYHEDLFKNTSLIPEGGRINTNVLISLAGQAGLDVVKFKNCLTNSETESLVKANIMEAEDLEITGVPFMFINNQEIMGAAGVEDIEKMIESELNRK